MAVQIAVGQSQPSFDIQGHRGARGLLPENAMAGFLRAVDLGVTTLEIDVVIAGDSTREDSSTKFRSICALGVPLWFTFTQYPTASW